MKPVTGEIYEIKARPRGNPPMLHMRAKCLGIIRGNTYSFEVISYELSGRWLSVEETRKALTLGHKRRWTIVERFTMTAQSFAEHVITDETRANDAVLTLALKCYNEATLSGTCVKDVIDLIRVLDLLDTMET